MLDLPKRAARALIGFALGLLTTVVQGQAAPATQAAAAQAPASEAPAAGSARQDALPASDAFDLREALRTGSPALTADQAAQMAMRTAPSVAAAQAASDKAQGAASEAFLAVYPRLDLEARYTRVSDVDTGSFEVPLPGGDSLMLDDPFDLPLDQYMLQARVSYPLSDLFFKVLPSYRASNRSAEAQAFNEKVAHESIGLSAREAYYNYARAKASLAVAQAGLAQSEAQRRDVAALVDAGTLARVELMRAEAVVASAQVGSSRAAGSLAVARTALRSLLHTEGQGDFAIEEDFTQPMPPLAQGIDALVATALQSRSEVKALQRMSEFYSATADVHSADELPKLSLGGSAEYAKPNQRAIGQGNGWVESWAVYASLTWSPNDLAGGSTRADQAQADVVRTQADMRALEDALRVEVTQAYEDFVAARAAMEASLTGIAAAEESYRVRREQFQAGAAVATDVVDAETDVRRARLELVNAAIDVRIARARLERALER